MQIIFDRLLELKNTLNTQAEVDSYRLFHGRGRCFPGFEFVTVDFFQPVILVTLFAEPPTDFVAQLQNFVAQQFFGVAVVLLLQRRYVSGAPSEILLGELPNEVCARRGGLVFNLHLARQQNSGFFLDIEPAREWLEQQAAGKRVLNLFAYSCAFSLVAIAAGAEKVVNVDMSSAALNLGRDNHRLNGLPKERSEYLAENILKSWSRIKKRGPYDLVIIDPPSYQKGSFIAHKDYAKVVRRLPELMPEGGVVLACLNAPELSENFLREQFAEQCPSAKFMERLQPHVDFPDVDLEQQLKLLVYKIPALITS